ncbi:DUF485 domain-containing protein [Streptomyces fructofermentans]|uniref:DUF485 domain-containing protein n=1 Tax=Streptomyces fructofermentans TaxID=152141 RepID=A0A918NSG1_9ACTN|nr:DUF485 domain-containing protein [Streptomyces fructofermentans]GGX92197.1 hypothetical protein GCM10010515_69100 [Streptomyces fructofermentans]
MSYDTSPSSPFPPPDPPPVPPHHAAPKPQRSQPSPSSPSYPTYPAHPAHHSSPTPPTYPWAPQPQAPEPVRPPRRRHTALGRHSDLRVLRTAYRRQRRVATLTALGYFTLFLVLSASAPSLMTSRVSDGLNVGLLLGLLQIPVTCAAIALYEFTARRGVDPLAERMRRQTELDTRRAEAAR